MKVVGLFSGIGGLELPFRRRNAETQLICDVWDCSREVLAMRFPDVPLHEDIRTLAALPKGVEVVTAGFPCTDLSQAGRTAGISGDESGLVSQVFRLLEKRDIEWLVLENVRNMLVLEKGRAMHFLTTSLEELGFRWAYRLVDSRFSGVPQRRHRVLMVASRSNDPRRVLFADDACEPPEETFNDDAFGFYWTEGLRGLGWAKDSVPPLKGGSSVGIPSPPAVWIPGGELGRRLVTPSVEDAEELQGFERGWTSPAQNGKRNGPRWKLVGNAVSVGASEWLVDRLYNPGTPLLEGQPIGEVQRWPLSAYGECGEVWGYDASLWPVAQPYRHLMDVLVEDGLRPLSKRAAAGFYERTQRASLNFDPQFIEDVREHAELGECPAALAKELTPA